MNKNPKTLKYNNDVMNDAIRRKDKNFVRDCLKNGVSANQGVKKEGGYTTSLILAVCEGDEEIVKILLEGGADPKGIDSDGKTALHHAAYKSKVKCVATLVNFPYKDSKVPQELAEINRCKMTAFEYALQDAMGSDEVLALLAKFETQITSEKLKKIISFGYIETLKIVLAEFKDINLGKLLLVAAEQHRLEIVKLLIAKGANPNYQDPQGNTALHFAVAIGFSMQQWLENANHPVRSLSEFINLESSKATITTLLQLGADINLQNNAGSTPLHNACNYMLKYTASVRYDNLKSGMPKAIGRNVEASLKIECLEILILLVNNKTNVYLKNKEQKHAFEIISTQLKKVDDNLTNSEEKKVNELINLLGVSKEKQKTTSLPLNLKKEENSEFSEESEEESTPVNFLNEKEGNSENLENLATKFLEKSSSQAKQLGKSMQKILETPKEPKNMKELMGSYYGYKWYLRDLNLTGKMDDSKYKEEKDDLDQFKTSVGWKK